VYGFSPPVNERMKEVIPFLFFSVVRFVHQAVFPLSLRWGEEKCSGFCPPFFSTPSGTKGVIAASSPPSSRVENERRGGVRVFPFPPRRGGGKEPSFYSFSKMFLK